VALVDEKGRPRISLGVYKNGPSVGLSDEKGNSRVSLEHREKSGVAREPVELGHDQRGILPPAPLQGRAQLLPVGTYSLAPSDRSPNSIEIFNIGYLCTRRPAPTTAPASYALSPGLSKKAYLFGR
jgi:hypothetical protein